MNHFLKLLKGDHLNVVYRGTSLMKKRHTIGPYNRPLPRVLWWSWGVGRFLMRDMREVTK